MRFDFLVLGDDAAMALELPVLVFLATSFIEADLPSLEADAYIDC